MKEIWKTVIVDGVEHPMYKVSNFGRIICLNCYRTGKPRICKLSKTKTGYLQVGIDGVYKLVHRIVAETFIPNPEGKKDVDHIDTNRKNNIVEVDKNGIPIEKSTITNLRWATRKENCNNPLTLKHHGIRGKFGEEHHRSIQIVQLTLNGQFIREWSCAAEAGRELGITSTHISACCRGRYKSAGGFRWMYYSDWVKLQHKKPSDIKPLF